MNIFFIAINPDFAAKPSIIHKSIKSIHSIKIDKMDFKGFGKMMKFLIKILAK